MDTERTIHELIEDHPGAEVVLQRWGIGQQELDARTLADVCAERGLDARSVLVNLWADARNQPADQRPSSILMLELLNHVSAMDHRYLQGVLPHIAALAKLARLSTVADPPESPGVLDRFEKLYPALVSHMQREETSTFPQVLRIIQGDRSAGCSTALRRELTDLQSEHKDIREILRQITLLTHKFQAPGRSSMAYRSMIHALASLRDELDRHMDEEDVLFHRCLTMG